MSSSAPALEELAHVRIVRELGARNPGTYLGKREGAHDVVLETYAGLDPNSARLVMESAKRLRASPKHPHIVCVIAADRIGGSISIVTDFVDGVPLEEVFFKMSLGARLRAVVDVLSALSALHMVPDGKPIVHGGILLRSAFAEKTGRTKLGFAYRQSLCIKKDSYAPEMLLGDEAAIDARTDVYGAGVLLWEAINGHALFGDARPEDVVREQLAGRIAKPHIAAHDRWAKALLPVIDRALAINPPDRFATIAEMAGALRIAVRARLMTHDDVIEELWPAETKPKQTSGIVPVADPAEPIVATAAAQIATPPPVDSSSAVALMLETPIVPSMEPATPPEGTASGIVPISEAKPVVHVTARPAPMRRSRTFIVFALAAGLVAAAATFAHFRVSHVVARPDATPEERPAVMVTAPDRAVVQGEDTTPTGAPAASGTPTPPTTPPTVAPRKERGPKRPAKGRGGYDPQSI